MTRREALLLLFLLLPPPFSAFPSGGERGGGGGGGRSDRVGGAAEGGGGGVSETLRGRERARARAREAVCARGSHCACALRAARPHLLLSALFFSSSLSLPPFSLFLFLSFPSLPLFARELPPTVRYGGVVLARDVARLWMGGRARAPRPPLPFPSHRFLSRASALGANQLVVFLFFFAHARSDGSDSSLSSSFFFLSRARAFGFQSGSSSSSSTFSSLTCDSARFVLGVAAALFQ